MDKVKQSIQSFTGRAGQHDTTVHETVAPAVQHEVVKPHQHEKINTAVDKEVHQDHYHRTVQPVADREVLPEQHTANIGAVQHREFDERDHDSTKRALAAEQSNFKDERVVQDTSHSQSVAAVVGGEHKHHHVHETIQPVIEKETIQPTVVHTTVPIHETHHKAATHHGTSALPAVTLDEFKQRGGVLGGREERYDAFKGEPKNIGGSLSGIHGKHDSAHVNDSTRVAAQHGDFDPKDGNLTRATGNVAEYETGGHGHGHGHHEGGFREGGAVGGAGLAHNDSKHHGHQGVDDRGVGTGIAPEHSSLDKNSHSHGSHGSHGNTAPVAGREPGQKKPSLMDKLNPRVDADGDGKPGFMK